MAVSELTGSPVGSGSVLGPRWYLMSTAPHADGGWGPDPVSLLKAESSKATLVPDTTGECVSLRCPSPSWSMWWTGLGGRYGMGVSALTLFFSFYQLTPLFTVRFQGPGTCFSSSRQERSALPRPTRGSEEPQSEGIMVPCRHQT